MISQRFQRRIGQRRTLGVLLAAIVVVAGLVMLGFQQVRSAAAASDYIGVITIRGTIDEGTDRYLSRAIGDASKDEARLVIIELDTPGGFLTSTRSMVETILESSIPVAVYVSPAGARAGSAGTFITAAANFAVMAPGSNIGAASPISSTGDDIPSTLEKKINEDTRAFIRSIADVRGRSAEALEETVTLARSYSAVEALELNVVDLIATNRDELLEQLNGRTAETANGTVIVRTEGATIRHIDRTFLEEALGILANPNIAGLLISLGSLALLIELLTPGSIGPGVIGVILLVLGYLGAGQLPLNWVALGLLVFGLVLFYVEMQVPGFGIFGIGGLIAFSTGLFFLFGNISTSPDISEPSVSISTWLVVALGLTMTAFLGGLVYLMRPTGYDVSRSDSLLVGRTAVALSDIDPSGRVEIDGQEWSATMDFGARVQAGDEVSISSVYADVLKVAPAELAPEKEPGGRLNRLVNLGKTVMGRAKIVKFY